MDVLIKGNQLEFFWEALHKYKNNLKKCQKEGSILFFEYLEPIDCTFCNIEFAKWIKRFERIIVTGLLALMVAVVFISTVELAVMLVSELLDTPQFLSPKNHMILKLIGLALSLTPMCVGRNPVI